MAGSYKINLQSILREADRIAEIHQLEAGFGSQQYVWPLRQAWRDLHNMQCRSVCPKSSCSSAAVI